MNNKLELHWIGKETTIEVEPRILIKDSSKSFAKNQDVSKRNECNFRNMLIHGDNLLALKALDSKFNGMIKCIYIDPPYNTGSAFEHYDDNVEHSTWLSLMKVRLEILKGLLKKDGGSIWISIDADECHYLKVLCDEIFGRNNFIDEIVWQRAYSPINLKRTLSRSHDSILVYARNKDENFQLNTLPKSDEAIARYKNPDNDPRGPWTSGDLSVGPIIADKVYEITTPSGRKVLPPSGYCWRLTKERFDEYIKDNRIWFGEGGNNTPRIKRFLSEVKNGVVAMTWWPREEVGDNQEAKREIKALFPEDKNPFDTPKPERLIDRILRLGSNEGDIILDSFLGSGTTCAVAQKMNRNWIGIEMTDSIYSFCKPRLDKVISGNDKGGVTKVESWAGGGSYDFYELAPTLIKIDKFGQYIINPIYDSNMLASAIAIHEGYVYHPDQHYYWKQANNGSGSFLYVTTNHVTKVIVDSIRAELLDDEYLKIVCKSFDENVLFDSKNITIKKIPQSLLKNCQFGIDNYNLNIVCPPKYNEEEDL